MDGAREDSFRRREVVALKSITGLYDERDRLSWCWQREFKSY